MLTEIVFPSRVRLAVEKQTLFHLEQFTDKLLQFWQIWLNVQHVLPLIGHVFTAKKQDWILCGEHNANSFEHSEHF